MKQYETRRVIYDGASEVDMVINWGVLKSGDLGVVSATSRLSCLRAGLRRVEQCHHRSGVLTDEEKISAGALSKAAGADYVRHRLGSGPRGATVADV